LIKHLLGWLLTAGAISLGAPFWFDLLNKFMVIRSTVKPFEKSQPEGSEDRRGGKAPGPIGRLFSKLFGHSRRATNNSYSSVWMRSWAPTRHRSPTR